MYVMANNKISHIQNLAGVTSSIEIRYQLDKSN